MFVALGFVVFLVAIGLALFLNMRRQKGFQDAHSPVSLAEFEAISDEMHDLRLPMLQLQTAKARPTLLGTRIGGRPWAPNDTTIWPLDETGLPMLFLAQLNFGTMPTIEDFPRTGLLQIFVEMEPDGELTYQEEGGGFSMVWYDAPRDGQLMKSPPTLSQGPFRIHSAERAGKCWSATLMSVPATWYDSPMDWDKDDVLRRAPATPYVKNVQTHWEDRMEQIAEASGVHWVGGHPAFAQDDIRCGRPDKQNLDRVLLHIGSDHDVAICDGGTINILISKSNLWAKRFEQAIYTFDSY